MMKRDYENAIKDCKKSLELEKNTKVITRLSKCYLFLGKVSDCIELLTNEPSLVK